MGWKDPNRPQTNWVREDNYQLEGRDQRCQWCYDQWIQNVFVMSHEGWPETLLVGYHCAREMGWSWKKEKQERKVREKREAEARYRAKREKEELERSAWLDANMAEILARHKEQDRLNRIAFEKQKESVEKSIGTLRGLLTEDKVLRKGEREFIADMINAMKKDVWFRPTPRQANWLSAIWQRELARQKAEKNEAIWKEALAIAQAKMVQECVGMAKKILEAGVGTKAQRKAAERIIDLFQANPDAILENWEYNLLKSLDKLAEKKADGFGGNVVPLKRSVKR